LSELQFGKDLEAVNNAVFSVSFSRLSSCVSYDLERIWKQSVMRYFHLVFRDWVGKTEEYH